MTSTATSPLVSLDDIRLAASALRGVAVRTPLVRSYELEERVGVPVYLKPEMLQRAGAFKFRGAYTYVSRLSPDERTCGLVAPSSGNHGQAVALAARLFGVKATIVMPTTTPRAKVAGAERLGARVLFAGTTTAERMAKAMEVVESESATLGRRTIIRGSSRGRARRALRSPRMPRHSALRRRRSSCRWVAAGCRPASPPR
jgi:threonine dehydratase